MTKCLVITGASQGIGEATAAHFIEQDWNVINISRKPSKIPKVKNFSIDLAEPKNLEKITDELRSAVKDASTLSLIHNAVFQTKDTVETITIEDLIHTLNINLISSTVLNKILIPMMKPGSSILYMGSMLADKGVPDNASYIISKHAVLGLMRSTCQDLGDKKIYTCCICPGLVETDLLRRSMDNELIDYVIDAHVVGKRLIQPQEIAKVLFACANSPVLNGALIPANLGLIAS